jgi:hypothetical protein
MTYLDCHVRAIATEKQMSDTLRKREETERKVEDMSWSTVRRIAAFQSAVGMSGKMPPTR